MLDEVNDRFRTVYNKLNKDTLEVLSDLYDVNVVFIDPIHTVHGLGELTEYCQEFICQCFDHSI